MKDVEAWQFEPSPIHLNTMLPQEYSNASTADTPPSQDRVADEIARQSRIAQNSIASQPILNELNGAGIFLKNLGSRFASQEDHIKAMPILHLHLEKDYPVAILKGIIDKLILPEALPYRQFFISKFKQYPHIHEFLREGFGFAIAKTTNSKNLHETISLLEDSSLGSLRITLLDAIKKRRNQPQVKELILELRLDKDLGVEIATWR